VEKVGPHFVLGHERRTSCSRHVSSYNLSPVLSPGALCCLTNSNPELVAMADGWCLLEWGHRAVCPGVEVRQTREMSDGQGQGREESRSSEEEEGDCCW